MTEPITIWSTFCDEIYRVQAEKVTASTVVLVTNVFGKPINTPERCNRRSNWQSFHDTWEEAHQYLIDKAQREVDSLRKQLERANGNLGRIRGMKPPEDA